MICDHAPPLERRIALRKAPGLLETTPWPLIMVLLQFVGFLAAYREAGWMSALLARLLGSEAPGAALVAVCTAVVGVILILAVWFAIHGVFRDVVRTEAGPLSIDLPRLGTIDWLAAALSMPALVAVFRLRLGMEVVLGGFPHSEYGCRPPGRSGIHARTRACYAPAKSTRQA